MEASIYFVINVSTIKKKEKTYQGLDASSQVPFVASGTIWCWWWPSSSLGGGRMCRGHGGGRRVVTRCGGGGRVSTRCGGGKRVLTCCDGCSGHWWIVVHWQ